MQSETSFDPMGIFIMVTHMLAGMRGAESAKCHFWKIAHESTNRIHK